MVPALVVMTYTAPLVGMLIHQGIIFPKLAMRSAFGGYVSPFLNQTLA